MKAINHKYKVLFFFFICISCLNAQSVLSDKYDLHFRNIDSSNGSWLISGGNIRIYKDSSQRIDGQIPNVITSSGLKISGREIKQNFIRLRQFIPVFFPAENIRVVLKSKSSYYNFLQIKVFCLNKNEEIEIRDSAILTNSDKWEETILNLNAKNTNQLYIEIVAKALGGDLTNKQEVYPRLCLESLTIMLDNKDIYSTLSDNDSICIEKKFAIKPLSLSIEDDSSFDAIKDWHTSQIIGLGETIHGSETITQSACQVIRHLVEKENCKLVFLELPYSLVLCWDLFIQGNDNINIERQIKLYNMQISTAELVKLFKWLREFNLKNEHKVHLVGMDINQVSRFPKGLLLNIFNNEIGDDSLKSEVINNYAVNSFNHQKLYAYFVENKKLKKYFSKWLYESLLYSLRLDEKVSKITKPLLSIRDSMMCENVKYAIDYYIKENEKAVIYAHFLHINKLNCRYPETFDKSLGHYLKNNFSSRYFAIGILAGKGLYASYDNTNRLSSKNILETPPKNSMEAYFNSASGGYLYSKVSEFDNLIKVRLVLNHVQPNNQFQYINPNQRIDAILYLRKSKAPEIPVDDNKDSKKNYYEELWNSSFDKALLRLQKDNTKTVK